MMHMNNFNHEDISIISYDGNKNNSNNDHDNDNDNSKMLKVTIYIFTTILDIMSFLMFLRLIILE